MFCYSCKMSLMCLPDQLDFFVSDVLDMMSVGQNSTFL